MKTQNKKQLIYEYESLYHTPAEGRYRTDGVGSVYEYSSDLSDYVFYCTTDMLDAVERRAIKQNSNYYHFNRWSQEKLLTIKNTCVTIN